MTDATMEVDDALGESSWHSSNHEDSSGDRGPAMTVDTGSASLKESRGGQAHAMTTSTAAEVDEGGGASDLIEAGFISADAGKKSPPPVSEEAQALPKPSTKQNILSRGDLPRENTQGDMTIIQQQPTTPPSSEAMAVDMDRRESDDEGPINLVSGAREEAINLTRISGLSVKMRLKKQRLEAAARAAAEHNSRPSYADHSALHRLAEAAERKQEEEMLEMSEGLTSSVLPYKLSTLLASTPRSGEVSITPIPLVHHTPSPDSAIHSGCYSPSQSPVQSRQVSGVSSPFSLASLSRHNSDASQRGSPSLHLSSPHDSPVQIRHRGLVVSNQHRSIYPTNEAEQASAGGDGDFMMTPTAAQPGISRQQLINSPCPVCGDKISGFHYGIFSCESCKGFFKRTVQNKKNYQCLRGANCPVSIATRKKCPACRFNKCLTTGMKLEAIREDRTRGGRSTYQCSYTLPPGMAPALTTTTTPVTSTQQPISLPTLPLPPPSLTTKLDEEDEDEEEEEDEDGEIRQNENVPQLIREIMDVEHLWFSTKPHDEQKMEIDEMTSSDENMVQTLTHMADKRLFKLVKWCKSLPLFKSILIDDQISLLINAWCELLVFSCCFRSLETPGVVRVSNQKMLSLEAARQLGIEKWIEKMLHFTDQLRRLKVDGYEYVSMKVIVLLTSDASGLKEPSNVRDSQEKVVQALQQYTTTHYPDMPSKFAELLLRMPELHRVCQGCKEMLCPRQPTEGEMPGFNLLMELLRGDH